MGRWVWAGFLWGVALAAGRAHLLVLGEDGRVYALEVDNSRHFSRHSLHL
jgi:alpha-tubulin suppressor-like RCC1 family protein